MMRDKYFMKNGLIWNKLEGKLLEGGKVKNCD